MGCKYSCTCAGFCPGCREFEPEEYVGHAEDVYDSIYGTYEDRYQGQCPPEPEPEPEPPEV